MIVSCPSCDSKYQVADEKVAGNVLRTRCKACGSQILVDGTIPPGPNNEEDDDVTRIMRPEDRPDLGESQAPASGNRWTVNVGDDTRPMTASEIVQGVVNGSLGDGVSVWKSGMANWASIADVPELMTAIEQTGRRPRPKSGSTKPPPPARGAAANASPGPARGPSNGPTRTYKPPPPARAPAPSFKSPAVKASPVVSISKPIENQKDALDPGASTGDFYSKLMNKVGSKSKSAPPTAAPEVKPANRPRATMPPPRDASPAMASRNSPGRTSTIKKEPPPVANVASNLDPDAAPSDFYGKLLAKVRPQTSDPAPPPAVDARLPGSGRTTLTPPTWGAIGNPSENYAQSHSAARVPPSTQPVASSPIRVLGSSSAAAESAAGAIDIPVNIDTDDAENEPKGAPAAAPVAVRRASPTPPKRPDPVIPVDIQLPPMDGAAEARAAGGPTVVVAKSTPPPAAGPIIEAKPEVRSETLIKPATEIVTDNTSPGLRARPGRRKGGGIIAILMVGLICAGGGVAATVYMLKKQENKNAGPAVPSASLAATQPSIAPAQASGSQPQATPPPTGTGEPFDADELARTGGPGAQAMRGAAGRRPAKAGAGETAADTPAAPSVASKPAAGAIDPTMPGWLEASVKSKADKAAAAKAAAPEKPAAPAKPSGPAFNRDAATAVLGIAASQAPSCKRPGGPTGNGKALVTFDTDGQVVIANIVGEGISGTPVARCVAGIFQRIKVAPFTGDRATVSKAFTIPP